MTDALTDSIQAVVALMNKMTEDYAKAHGRAAYGGESIDDGWDELPTRISSANQELNDVWSSTKSHSEHRHIRAVEETLGELHDCLGKVASSVTNYLTVEASTKKKMDGEGQVDMLDLERARNQLEKAEQAYETARSNLVNNIGNLSMDG
jgi:hypothetical protein